MLGDRLEQCGWARLFDGRACGAEPQRKQRRDAEPEREGHWRRRHEDVTRLRVDEMLRKRVARRENVAVELDAALGHPGRAAGEGDQRRIIAAGVEWRQWLQ